MSRRDQRWADYVLVTGVIYHIIKGLARALTVLAGQYSDCAMASPEWAHQDAISRAVARRYTNTFKDTGPGVTVAQSYTTPFRDHTDLHTELATARSNGYLSVSCTSQGPLIGLRQSKRAQQGVLYSFPQVVLQIGRTSTNADHDSISIEYGQNVPASFAGLPTSTLL